MIKIFGKDNIEIQFELTKFPDNTSQCWKLKPEPKTFDKVKVKWDFENEGELFQICQLGYLLWQKFMATPILVTDYLPFARQDKHVDNNLTFAKEVFIQMIRAAGFDHIEAYDAHSEHYFVKSRKPYDLIEAALPGHHIVCFPDAGAKTRYLKLVQGIARNSFQDDVQFIWAEKKRNQQTGEITGLELKTNGLDLTGKNILVFDDICDGGKTFTVLIEELKKHNPGKMDLAVSHGLFSKGHIIIFEAGYETIYTTNSLLNNFDVGNFTGYWNGIETLEKYLNIIDINGLL